MQRLDMVLDRASRWLMLVRLVPAVIVALTAATALLLVSHAVTHVLGVRVDWMVTWLATVGAAMMVAACVVLFTRPTRFTVAQLLDDRGELREALSTAVWLRTSPQAASHEGDAAAWDHAAVHHAERTAERVEPRVLIPVVVPRWWFAPLLLAGAFFVVGLFPSPLLLERESPEVAVVDDSEDTEQVKTAVEEAELLAREALVGSPEAERVLEQLQPDTLDASRTPEEMRREAARRLTAAKDALDKLASGPDAQTLDELRRRTAEMRTPAGATGVMAEMSKALQQGDFARAAMELEKLKAKFDAGEMSAAEREQLAAALEALAKQLEAAAKQNAALRQALQQAGMNQNLSQNPQAAQQAIQQNQNLSAQQRQQLQQMAQAAEQAQQQLNQAASACRQCAGGMKSGQSGRAGQQGQQGQHGASQAMGQLASQLSQLGAMQQQVKQAQAASNAMQQKLTGMGQCSGGSGQGGNPFAGMFAGGGSGGPPQLPGMGPKHQPPGAVGVQQGGGDPNQRGNGGNGAGGRGAGSSGGAGLARDETDRNLVDLDAHLDSTKNVGGEVISTEFVDDNGMIRPEAVQQLSQAIVERERSAEDSVALNETVYPAEYHDAIRAYYERLTGRVRDAERSGDAAGDASGSSGGEGGVDAAGDGG